MKKTLLNSTGYRVLAALVSLMLLMGLTGCCSPQQEQPTAAPTEPVQNDTVKTEEPAGTPGEDVIGFNGATPGTVNNPDLPVTNPPTDAPEATPAQAATDAPTVAPSETETLSKTEAPAVSAAPTKAPTSSSGPIPTPSSAAPTASSEPTATPWTGGEPIELPPIFQP